MGEAKRRGTYEERKILAIKREKNKPPEKKSQIIINGKRLAEFLTFLGIAGGYNRFTRNCGGK